MKTKGDGSGLKLKRIFEIHKVLRKSRRGYSAEELADCCREVDPGVDKRTIMNDLKFLREVLNAPLPERANKHHGYYYEDPYSILEGLDDSPLGSLNEALALLRQLTGTKEFIGLEDLLLRLEQRVALTRAETNIAIEFDTAELIGRHHLIGLYNAIQKQNYLRVTYQPFQQEAPDTRHIFPLLLKEYNNRWFLIGWESGRETPQTLPLDRITSFYKTSEVFTHPRFFDGITYFEHLIGVTKSGQEPKTVLLRFTKNRANYVKTKKIHPKQKETELPNGSLEVELVVDLNRELEAQLLSFGKDVIVLAPLSLQTNIRAIMEQALETYKVSKTL